MKRIALMLVLAGIAGLLVAVPVPSPAYECGYLHPGECVNVKTGVGSKIIHLLGYDPTPAHTVICGEFPSVCEAGDIGPCPGPTCSPMTTTDWAYSCTDGECTASIAQNPQCSGVDGQSCAVDCTGDYEIKVAYVYQNGRYDGKYGGRIRGVCSRWIPQNVGEVAIYHDSFYMESVEGFAPEYNPYSPSGYNKTEVFDCEPSRYCRGHWRGFATWIFDLGTNGYWTNWNSVCQPENPHRLVCNLSDAEFDVAPDNN